MGGRGGGGGGGQTGAGAEKEVSSEEYLDRFEEELHKKVDAEMEILVDGLGDCVRLSKVRAFVLQGLAGADADAMHRLETRTSSRRRKMR